MSRPAAVSGLTLVLLTTAYLLCDIEGSPQQTNIVSWGDAMAEKLAKYLPEPAPGIAPGMPWDHSTDHQPGHWAGVSGAQSPLYLPFGVTQRWSFDDPTLVRQVAEAKEQSDADKQARTQEARQYQKTHAAELVALRKQAQDLQRQEKTQEAQTVMKKLLQASSLPGWEAQGEGSRWLQDLQTRVRSLIFRIEANLTLDNRLGGQVQQIHSLGGHQLYRSDSPGALKSPNSVSLAVYLGPPRFRNLPSAKPQEQVKCILVSVEVRSRSETLKNDEAVARQMLEHVDYAGLAKLLTP